MSEKLIEEIEECIRNNVTWQNIPAHLKHLLQNTPKKYEQRIVPFSLKNQLRYKGNLVRKVYKNEQRYYELLVDTSINLLSLFPYHLADIVTKGLRVTPFNYYLDVVCFLLKNDKSYDTLPNFTAADCLRVLGIGRNEYLTLISELKTNSSKIFRKPNPLNILPKFPVRINIEPWWKIEVGYVLETDIKFVNIAEKSLIDDLIDFGSLTAGQIDYDVVHSLYRKGLIYLDVPVSGEDTICIPPLRNFVMNRVSGDYFENLLYKVFVGADEHMTISELSQMLQVNLDTVKHAVSLFCRLGFAKKKNEMEIPNINCSWLNRDVSDDERPQITPLNYHSLLLNETDDGFINDKSNSFSQTNKKFNNLTENSPNSPTIDLQSPKTNFSNSTEYISSDANSDFSFLNKSSQKSTSDSQNELYSEIEENNDFKVQTTQEVVKPQEVSLKSGKRVGFLFDSTLTAFLMMGNLSPGLKNHAVTMFEVGKLCDESMNTFLSELEKVSLIDAEGEGEVSRYFAHAVILRSTIIALRNILDAGLDLLRLECLESLDQKTRDRLLEKKYKFIISATPLTSNLTHLFPIPFFGQFYKSIDNTHIWTKLFYYHISGYGLPSLLLIKGTVLKSLPRIFLGYGKLLITIIHSDSYIINSDNYKSLNDALKNGCVLIQGYGIRQPGELRYESFPFDKTDPDKRKWSQHKAIEKLSNILNLENTCGYVTLVNSGVADIGCENYDINVILQKPSSKKNKRNQQENEAIKDNERKSSITQSLSSSTITQLTDLNSPLTESIEISNFNKMNIKTSPAKLKSPDENYFAITPQNTSPSNVYRSDDCNELLAKELAKLEENISESDDDKKKCLVSQSSIEIAIDNVSVNEDESSLCEIPKIEDTAEEWTLLDVNFGVPLFDVDCNTRICEDIVRILSKEENLQKLQTINTDMNNKFLKFVSQCMYFHDDDIGFVKIGKLIPPPRICLAFENGKVTNWNGK